MKFINESCHQLFLAIVRKTSKYDHFFLVEKDDFLTLTYDGYRIFEVRKYGLDYLEFETFNRYRTYRLKDFIEDEYIPESESLLEMSKFLDSLTYLSIEFSDYDFFRNIILNLKF